MGGHRTVTMPGGLAQPPGPQLGLSVVLSPRAGVGFEAVPFADGIARPSGRYSADGVEIAGHLAIRDEASPLPLVALLATVSSATSRR